MTSHAARSALPRRRPAGAAVLLAALLLAACAPRGEPDLMTLRSSTSGPDEFAIVPSKPLELPPDLAALPDPTPGGANRTDPTPHADAVAALGGDRGRIAGGPAAADQALLAQSARFGIAPDIRSTLAAEDRAWRQSNRGRVLERLFSVNLYFRAYEPMSLDQYAELERWRAVGVQTVGAPPPAP